MKSRIFSRITSSGCLSLTVFALNSCSVGPTKAEQEAAYARMVAEKAQADERLRGSRPSRGQFIAAIQKHLAEIAIDPSTPTRTRNFQTTIYPLGCFWVIEFEANGKNRMGGWTGWQVYRGLWTLDGKDVSIVRYRLINQ